MSFKPEFPADIMIIVRKYHLPVLLNVVPYLKDEVVWNGERHEEITREYCPPDIWLKNNV
jgi:hypothetical protein